MQDGLNTIRPRWGRVQWTSNQVECGLRGAAGAAVPALFVWQSHLCHTVPHHQPISARLTTDRTCIWILQNMKEKQQTQRHFHKNIRYTPKCRWEEKIPCTIISVAEIVLLMTKYDFLQNVNSALLSLQPPPSNATKWLQESAQNNLYWTLLAKVINSSESYQFQLLSCALMVMLNTLASYPMVW